MKKSILVLLAATLGFFYSCEKESFTIEDNALEELDVTFRSSTDGAYSDGLSEDGKGRRFCFRPVFPLTLVFVDSSQVKVANLEELKAAILKFKTDNPTLRFRPKIAFPHEVELEDGTIVEVSTPEEVHAIRKECRPAPLTECFAFNFPIKILDKEGKEIVINSEEELKSTCERKDQGRIGFGLGRRQQGRGNHIAKPKLVFPITITLKADGSKLTLNSPDDLKEVVKNCLND